MRRPSIIEVATIAGLGGFFYTLATSTPPPGPRETPARSMGRAPMRGDMPFDVTGLENWVRNRPGDTWGWYSLARRQEIAGRKDRAIEAWQEIVKRTPSEESAGGNGFGRARFALGAAYDALGEPEKSSEAFAEAAAWYRERIAQSNFGANRGVWKRLGWALYRSGDEKGARQAWADGLKTLEGVDPQGYFVDEMRDLAAFHALLGNDDQAILWLTRTVEQWIESFEGVRADDPEAFEHADDFAFIRDDPRFQRIVMWLRDAATRRIHEQIRRGRDPNIPGIPFHGSYVPLRLPQGGAPEDQAEPRSRPRLFL